jgi:hypothetical protein
MVEFATSQNIFQDWTSLDLCKCIGWVVLGSKEADVFQFASSIGCLCCLEVDE